MATVYFNSQYNAVLSNFSECQGIPGGYKTVEAFFQAMKTMDLEKREAIRLARTPADARAMGRKVQLRTGWTTMRLEVMRWALRRKFHRDPNARRALLSTGQHTLVHESPWDLYWGADRNGRGQNILGQMLMSIRAELT